MSDLDTTARPVAADVGSDPGGRPGWRTSVAYHVAQLPDRLALLFLCVVISVGVTATFGRFQPVFVVPLFLLAVVLVFRCMPEPVAATAGAVWAAGAVLAAAVVFVWVNLPLTSEYFVVVRDPAVYTLRAIWMTTHASPNIADPLSLRAASGVPGALVDANGFVQHGAAWEPQGATLVPGLLAIGGWIAGTTGVLHANLFIGGFALLALFAVGRRLMAGHLWALAPVVALGVSMPMVAFSRSPYTEPTALALGATGILLMQAALTTPRLRCAALAGVSLGATFLARIDGLVFVLAGTVALGAAYVLSHDPERRRWLRHCMWLFLAGAAAVVLVAYLDLGRNSAPYEQTSWAELQPLTMLTILVALGGLVVTMLPPWRSLAEHMTRRSSQYAAGVAVLIAVLFVMLLFRPLYYVAHHTTDGVSDIASRQSAANLPVDATRTYDELTLNWLAWYYGWPLVILGGCGACVMTWLAWRRRDAAWVLVLTVLGTASALYLNRASITPDQIWAVRRFLPIVIPFGLIAGFAMLALVYRHLHRRSFVRRGVAAAAVVLSVSPLLAWHTEGAESVFWTREYLGAESFVDQLCATAEQSDPDAQLVVADHGNGGTIVLPALRVRCQQEIVLVSDPSPQNLLRLQASYGPNRPIVVLTFLANGAPWTKAPTQPNFVGTFTLWEEPLTRRPQIATQRTISAYVGDLLPDGLVAPRR